MKKITDEQLNKYIDAELESGELDEIKAELQSDENSLAHLKSLRTVHESLKQIETDHAPDGFTERVMKLISTKTSVVKRKVSYFFVAMVSILSIGIVAVVSAMLKTPSTGSNNSISSQLLDNAKTAADKNLIVLQKFFSDANVLLVMSILSLVLLFGAYFTVDAHKNFKNKLNNISH